MKCATLQIEQIGQFFLYELTMQKGCETRLARLKLLKEFEVSWNRLDLRTHAFTNSAAIFRVVNVRITRASKFRKNRSAIVEKRAS